MTLAFVLEQINAARLYAEENVESGAIETLAGRRARKNRAIEDIKRLKRQYKDLLLKSAVFVVVTGAEANEFETQATEKFECMASKADAVFDTLAKSVPTVLFMGKEINAAVFGVASRHFEDLASDLDITEYPTPQFNTRYNKVVNSREEFVDLLSHAFTEQVGGELTGIYAVNQLVDSAIAKNHSNNVTPIIMATSNTRFASSLVPALERLTPRVFMVLAGKGPKELKANKSILAVKSATAENVEEVLKTIKSNLKK